MRKLVALGVAAALLTGCTPTLGTAAVVGDEKISVASVQESVTQIVQQRRDVGEPSTGDVVSGQQAADQLRFQLISIILAKAAAKYGVTVSPAEVEAYRADALQQIGGEANLLNALTRNAIAVKDFELYINDVLLQKKLGEKLVAGDANDSMVASKRNDAVNKAIFETMAATKITVNPRFGVFDPTNGTIMIKDYTNGAVLPRE